MLYAEPWLQWRSMNPLGLAAERFVVATSNSSGNLLGFGQLEPKPSAQDTQFLELRTMIVKPEYRRALLLDHLATAFARVALPLQLLLLCIHVLHVLKWPLWTAGLLMCSQ